MHNIVQRNITKLKETAVPRKNSGQQKKSGTSRSAGISTRFSNARKAQNGQSLFNTSSLTSPFIVKIIQFMVDNGVNRQLILDKVNKAIAEYKERVPIAPHMMTACAANCVESTVYSIFKQHKFNVEGASRFSNGIILGKLHAAVIEDNVGGLLPLRDVYTRKTLKGTGMPHFISLPSPNFPPDKFPQYSTEKITTACCTPDAKIFFNADFAQSLINWAFLKEVKPKSAKYKCNGGDIPDDLCYLEFVLAHELYHFSFGDFYIAKKFKLTNTDSNYAGDFRINYQLVANGYEQLPFGLFSDTINFDIQKTYMDMVRIVKDERKKLKEKDKDDNMDDQEMDQHVDGDGEPQDSDGDEGDAQKRSGSSGGEGEDGEDEDSGEDGDNKGKGKGKGKDGDGKEDGDEKGKGKGKDKGPSEEDFNENDQDVINRGNKRKDLSPKERQQAQADRQSKEKPIESKPSGDGVDGKFEIDLKDKRAAYSWRTLLSRAVTKLKADYVTVWNRIARDAVRGADMAVQHGAGSVKPGEIQNEHVKLALVIDSSGSMGHIIDDIFAEFCALLKSKQVPGKTYLYKFSSNFEVFLINGRKPNPLAASCSRLDRKTGKVIAQTTVKEALYHLGAGTDISNDLLMALTKRVKEGFNVILASDSDALWASNAEALVKLLEVGKANGNSVFIILDSRATYLQAVKRFGAGVRLANLSYWTPKTKKT